VFISFSFLFTVFPHSPSACKSSTDYGCLGIKAELAMFMIALRFIFFYDGILRHSAFG
jgi:hypothetical protein